MPAHVSLFHHLPSEEIASVLATMVAACRTRHMFDLKPERLVPLGRGVAIAYRSRMLDALHADLAREWTAWLTPQDRQPFRAHVTIQNKVAPDEARALLQRLTLDVAPACRVEGLDLWRYRSGPWEPVETVVFAAAAQ